jgi:hypothetical protein
MKVNHSGIAYLDKCPIRREIPIYLLVGGTITMAILAMLIMQRWRRRDDRVEIEYCDDVEYQLLGTSTYVDRSVSRSCCYC